MQKISCADFAFPLLSHDNSLKLIKMMDIDYVDIGLFENRSHIQPSGELSDPEKNGKLLARRISEHGLGITDIFIQTSLDFKEVAINHPDANVRAEQREIFKKFCTYAKSADCNHISGLPGVHFDDSSWGLGAEELHWRSEYAKNLGITYAVEAHVDSIIESPSNALKMLSDANGLTLTLDHSHYTLRGIPTDDLQSLMNYASHMHIRGARKGEIQCSVERNTTDFALVAEHMRNSNYTGNICIEYTYTDWENSNRTDNVSETILMKTLIQNMQRENRRKYE